MEFSKDEFLERLKNWKEHTELRKYFGTDEEIKRHVNENVYRWERNFFKKRKEIETNHIATTDYVKKVFWTEKK